MRVVSSRQKPVFVPFLSSNGAPSVVPFAACSWYEAKPAKCQWAWTSWYSKVPMSFDVLTAPSRS
jgi:hypothetical protein